MSAPEETVIFALHALEDGSDVAMAELLLELNDKSHAELVQIFASSSSALLAVLGQFADVLEVSREEMADRFEAAWHVVDDRPARPKLRLVESPP